MSLGPKQAIAVRLEGLGWAGRAQSKRQRRCQPDRLQPDAVRETEALSVLQPQLFAPNPYVNLALSLGVQFSQWAFWEEETLATRQLTSNDNRAS